MIYAVYTTENFDKETKKLSQNDQKIIKKIFFKIKENPYPSDQLRFRHLREKHLREKRIYFLLYDDLKIVLIVAINGKKEQQATINHIVNYFREYRVYLERLIKNN